MRSRCCAWFAPEPGTNPRFLYQQNSLRDALVAALSFNIFNHHCQRVSMTNIAQTINVLQALILTEEGSDRILLTPTYHVFDMYKVHQNATLLPLDLRCDDYTCGEFSMPSLSASASRDADGRVHLTLCHVDPNRDAELRCELRGLALHAVRGRVLTADSMTAHNTFDAPEQVRPTDLAGATLQGNQLAITIPSKSVVLLELDTSEAG